MVVYYVVSYWDGDLYIGNVLKWIIFCRYYFNKVGDVLFRKVSKSFFLIIRYIFYYKVDFFFRRTEI